MGANALYRLGGVAALLAGILSIVIEIVVSVTIGGQTYSSAALTGAWSTLYATRLIAIVLLMLGLVALYARQSQKMRVFGLVAFVLASIGTMMIFGFAWALAFTFPAMAATVPAFLDAHASDPGAGVMLTLLLTVLGWFLFGLASLRAKVLPAGPAWLVMLGAVVSLALNIMRAPFSWVVFDLGILWMGWWLWSERV